MKALSGENPRICIIGAGPCGLTAAKNLIQQGLTNFIVFEKNSQLGGNWVFDERESHSSVYETTHIISSKYLSEFEDYIMPPGYSEYPSHSKILYYFQVYADHFGIPSYIRFNTSVLEVKPLASSNQWQILYQDETGQHEAIFDYVLVANGHHWDPVEPTYPGHFTGEILHAHLYKRAAPFKDKRVLVVGSGNSACDIAVEIARISEKTCISMRRGQHIFPKFILGKPADIAFYNLRWLPFRMKQLFAAAMLRLVQGTYRKYNLKKPETKPLTVHPTINSELLYYIRHGKISPYQGIERLEDKTVYFVDGRKEDFDTIIYATGYRISFPFFSKSLIDYSTCASIPLYRKMMHPDFDNLYFIGLFQPQGCIWPLADYQARIAASIIKGTLQRPANLTKKIEQEKKKHAKHFKGDSRHSLEVDYAIFKRQLLAELRKTKPTEKVRKKSLKSILVQ